MDETYPVLLLHKDILVYFIFVYIKNIVFFPLSPTKEKTVVYISHRLSSAVLSNRIYVFDNGTVSESGTHDELMKNGGEYCEMFTLQASNYIDGEEGDKQ